MQTCCALRATERFAGLTAWGALQTTHEIERIVHEAQAPTGAPGWENDEYIDDAMDNAGTYEGSFDEWGMGTSI